MRIQVRHRLAFDIGPGRAHAVQQVLLWPQTGPSQTVVDWRIEMAGFETASSFFDAYGNKAFLVSQSKPEAGLPVLVSGLVETVDRAGVLGRVPGEPAPALFRRITALTRPIAAVQSAFVGASTARKDRIPLLHGIMARVSEVLAEPEPEAVPAQRQSQEADGQSQAQGEAEIEAAEVAPPPPDAVALAHAFIATARALEIPARMVFGYLAAEDAEPARLHRWAEAYDEGLGWIGFDPSLQICPADRHIRVATGLDASAVRPVRCIPLVSEEEAVELAVAAA